MDFLPAFHNSECVSLLSRACYMHFPSHSPWQRVQVTHYANFITSYDFISFDPNILLSNPFSNSARDKVSHSKNSKNVKHAIYVQFLKDNCALCSQVRERNPFFETRSYFSYCNINDHSLTPWRRFLESATATECAQRLCVWGEGWAAQKIACGRAWMFSLF